MSTHDYNLANASGAAFRADANSVLGAIATRNSSSSAPSTTFSYQVWVDTTSNVIKHRNAANSGWLVDATADESFVLSRSSNTLLDLSDWGKTIVATSSFTQTLDAAATLTDGWFVGYRNDGSGVITLDPNSSETIDGATTTTLQPGEGCLIYCNGTSFKTIGRRRVNDLTEDTAPDPAADFIETWDVSATAHKKVLLGRGSGVLGTEIATTSGSSQEFTGIPSWVKKITLNLVAVSASGNNDFWIQIGPSGGVETSGYVQTFATVKNAVATVGGGAPSGQAFIIVNGIVAGGSHYGSVTLTLENASTNTWSVTGICGVSGQATIMAGSKALAGVLSRLKVLATAGDTFDNGAINILYE